MAGNGRVAILGFSAFERQTLESYFRIAAQRGTTRLATGFELTHNLSIATLMLVDADQAGLVLGVIECGRLGDCVLIGGRMAPAGAAAWLPRPVDALQVARTLAEIQQHRTQRGMAQALADSRPRTIGPSARARQQAMQQNGAHRFGSVDGYSNAVVASGDFRLANVLIISDDEFEWRPLHALLDRLGYDVGVSHTSRAGLTQAQQRPWRFVFLGARLSAPGPFEACKALKAQRDPDNAAIVVVLNTAGKAIDRIRATFAGADACLDNTALTGELMSLLSRHDTAFERVFEPTAPMAL